MIEQGRTYIVMGLLDPASIAYAIGDTISKLGGNVVYTMQSERMRRIFYKNRAYLSAERGGADGIRPFAKVMDQKKYIRSPLIH